MTTNSFRKQNNGTVVQGSKYIRMLLDHGVKLKKLGVTVPEEWKYPDEIHSPAIDVIRNPDLWPADEHYVQTIHVVRKFMGTSAQPAEFELWAEVPTNQLKLPKANVNRALIMHYFRDDRELGEVIRAARALAFDAGIYCGSYKSMDPYSPTALRASRCQTLLFPLQHLRFERALETALQWECIPVNLR